MPAQPSGSPPSSTPRSEAGPNKERNVTWGSMTASSRGMASLSSRAAEEPAGAGLVQRCMRVSLKLPWCAPFELHQKGAEASLVTLAQVGRPYPTPMSPLPPLTTATTTTITLLKEHPSIHRGHPPARWLSARCPSSATFSLLHAPRAASRSEVGRTLARACECERWGYNFKHETAEARVGKGQGHAGSHRKHQ